MNSIFEIFKIGIGPSSSHTTGPMVAARRFVEELRSHELLDQTDSITVDVYGSLALTGIGHGTDRAILLGLMGEEPEHVDPATIQHKFTEICCEKRVVLLGNYPIDFDVQHDLTFHSNELLTKHPNPMQFTAYDWGKRMLSRTMFYSVGGGFIVAQGDEKRPEKPPVNLPYPFSSGADLLRMGSRDSKFIWQMVWENEKVFRPEEEIRGGIIKIWQMMKQCTRLGLATEGILPGGLNVRRRAPGLYRTIGERDASDAMVVIDWINLFAIAVNEENAAGGRVVTAPTNGAAGVVPAVAHYYLAFVEDANEEGILRYLLTAAAIGILYKENASISGAEVGCQGEVGVACSMAAAGLVAALGGTNEEVEHAAEIGMEHNLGMTCDPVGGLVQIPCIERNAFGAVKAVNAARMSMNDKGGHKVSLDQVIRTMYQTGKDMQTRYKETALGGLALNVIQC